MSKKTCCEGQETWRESCPGSGIWLLGPVDGPHVRVHRLAGDPGEFPWAVWGMNGVQIDLTRKTERQARASGRLALREHGRRRKKVSSKRSAAA